MKKISKRNLCFKHRLRSRPGISLVEVIMVLGISSMLIAGSFAWFDSRKSSDFYDQVRQIESKIREVQSENTSSLVPGYDSASGSPCNQLGRSGCIIGGGEEVFGTAVSMAVPNAGDTTKLKISYLKKGAPTGVLHQSLTVSKYHPQEIELPATIKLEGFTVFGDGMCTTPPLAWKNWRELPNTGGSGAGYQDYNGLEQESTIVFRRTTGGYNAFWPTAGLSAFDTAGVTNGSKPWWDGTSEKPSWLGSYDDASYTYLSTNSSPYTKLRSQPCAVLWRLGSVERSATDNTKPRFTAEINFNLVDGATTIQTR